MYALFEDLPAAQAAGDFMDPNSWGELPAVERIYLDRTGDLYCTVSREDYPFLIRWSWCPTYSGRHGGQARRAWYARRCVGSGKTGPRRTVWLHKEVLARVGPPPSPRHFIGDHLSGKTLDNTRSNLRWATPDENNRNRHGFYVTAQYDFFYVLTRVRA